jgi:hypothetical protein
MKWKILDPPRTFQAGRNRLVMKDVGEIRLEPDEQVTFKTDSGTEYDVARKSWGYYATPSLNGRLPRFNLRPVLVAGQDGKQYVHLVETGFEEEHASYLEQNSMRLLVWLDAGFNPPDQEPGNRS